MPVTYGEASWIDLLSERMEREVCRATGLPADKVFLSFERPEQLAKNPPGDRFVSVAPARMPVDAKLVAGAGALHTGFDSVWHVVAFARLTTDLEYRDTRLVRDGAKGLAALVRRVCADYAKGGLQLNPLVASDGAGTASPLREPMRLLDAEWHPRDPAAGHAWCRIAFSVKFRTDLTVQ